MDLQNNEHKCSLSTPTWSKLIIFIFPVSDMQCASVILCAGKVFVRAKGWWQKRFPGGVSGQPEAGAKQEQGNEGKYQEVSGRGQKTGGVRRIETSSKEIC